MAEDLTPGMVEPRAAGRRYAPEPDGPAETPRFSLDGSDLTRYIPDPSPETIVKATEASLKVTELPHVVHQARIAVIAALRAEGYSRKMIGDAMGMQPSGVSWCLRKARDRGLMLKGMEEAIREMDEEAIPLAVENIIQALQDGNTDVAIKVAAGRGLLRSYATNKNDGPAGGAGNMAFQINFMLPDGGQAPTVADLQGKIRGTRKT